MKLYRIHATNEHGEKLVAVMMSDDDNLGEARAHYEDEYPDHTVTRVVELPAHQIWFVS